ncbi:MAG: hypothetical protein RIM84_16095 [Alphaproteobacteria bacterium]
MATLLGAALAATLLALAYWYAPVNRDAGYYVPLAMRVAEGFAPVRDFRSGYTPGTYYLLAMFGTDALASLAFVKLLMAGLHLLNAALVFVVARKVAKDTPSAMLLAILFLLWCLSSDGSAVVLEPFQNLFILLGLVASCYMRSYLGALAVGIGAGAALMCKQYSLLSLPALALLSLWPLAGERSGRSLPAFIAFAVGLGLPFLAFALATWQDPIALALYYADFGGRAGGYADTANAARAWFRHIGLNQSGVALVLPVLAIAALVLVASPGRRTVALALGFGCNLVPLLIRPYDHYAQLSAPWGTLLIAELVAVAGATPVGRLKGGHVVALLASLLLLHPALAQGHKLLRWGETGALAAQLDFSAQVRAAIPADARVVVVNAPWLHLTTSLQPPAMDYSFAGNPGVLERLLPQADTVLVFPSGSALSARTQSLLEENRFEFLRNLSWSGRSQYGTSVSLFHAPERRNREMR